MGQLYQGRSLAAPLADASARFPERGPLWALTCLADLELRCRVDGRPMRWRGRVVEHCASAPRVGTLVEARSVFASLPARARIARGAGKVAPRELARSLALISALYPRLRIEARWADDAGAPARAVQLGVTASPLQAAFQVLAGAQSPPLAVVPAQSSLPQAERGAHEGVVLHGWVGVWVAPASSTGPAAAPSVGVHALFCPSARSAEPGTEEECEVAAALRPRLAALPLADLGLSPAKARTRLRAEAIVCAKVSPAVCVPPRVLVSPRLLSRLRFRCSASVVRSGPRAILHTARPGPWRQACARFAEDAAASLVSACSEGTRLPAVRPATGDRRVAAGPRPRSAARGRTAALAAAPALPVREPVATGVSAAELATARVVGQVDLKFILLHLSPPPRSDTAAATAGHASGDGLIVDQHAADERVRYERMRAEVATAVVAWRSGRAPTASTFSTHAVDPEWRCSDAATAERLLRHREVAGRWGFDVRAAGSSHSGRGRGLSLAGLPRTEAACAVLRGAPSVLGARLSVPHLLDLVEECEAPAASLLGTGDVTRLPRCFLEVVKSQSCRGAIMFGDSLDHGQCVALVRALARCRDPFSCAHGRPTVAPVGLLAPQQ